MSGQHQVTGPGLPRWCPVQGRVAVGLVTALAMVASVLALIAVPLAVDQRPAAALPALPDSTSPPPANLCPDGGGGFRDLDFSDWVPSQGPYAGSNYDPESTTWTATRADGVTATLSHVGFSIPGTDAPNGATTFAGTNAALWQTASYGAGIAPLTRFENNPTNYNSIPDTDGVLWTLRVTFSEPVFANRFLVGEIDSAGGGSDFVDDYTLVASLGGTPVPPSDAYGGSVVRLNVGPPWPPAVGTDPAAPGALFSSPGGGGSVTGIPLAATTTRVVFQGIDGLSAAPTSVANRGLADYDGRFVDQVDLTYTNVHPGGDNLQFAFILPGGGCPTLGSAKEATSITQLGDGTYDVVYTIRVQNVAPIPATAVQLSDDFNATFAPGTVNSVGLSSPDASLTPVGAYGGSGPMLVGTDGLASGAIGTLVATVNVDASAISAAAMDADFSNQVTASATYGTTIVTDLSDAGADPDPTSTNGAGGVDDATLIRLPRVDVVKTVVLGPAGTCPGIDGVPLDVVIGQTATWCIDVTNTGGTILDPVDVTDATLGVSQDEGPLAPGESSTITVDGVITADVTNTADVTATSPTGDVTDSDDAEVNAVTQADLSITKSDAPDPVVAGTGLTYTLSVASAGPNDATAVQVVDTLPAGVTFVSAGFVAPATGSCAEAGGVVTCDLTGPLVSGGGFDIVIDVTVDSDTVGPTLTNDATVSSAATDPDLSDNSVSEDTTVTTSADLSVSKADSPDPVIAGDPLSYTVSVANAGPSDALAVQVVDTLPAGVTFSSASFVAPATGSCAEAGGVVTCDLTGALAAGGSFDVVIDVTVDSDTVGPTLTNDVAVSSSTPDPDPSDNTASEDTAVDTAADLSVSKADSPDPVVAGTGLTYTITVANAGPSDALAVQVVDTLPADVSFDAAAFVAPATGSCAEAGGVVTCDLTGALAAGGSFDVTIDVTVDVSATGTLTNDVAVSSTTPDPDPSDNTDSEDTAVGTSADLSITKADSPDPVVAGTGLTYTLVVSNAGPSNAAAVQVVDTLPAGVSFVSALFTAPASGACGASGTPVTVTCDLTGPLAAGGSFEIVISTTVDSDVVGPTVTNDATVSSSTPDPDLSDNSVSEDTTVTTSADLSVSKADSPDPVVAGTGLTYSVTVANAGPSDALAVQVVDTLPAGVTFSGAAFVAPSTGSCAEAGGVVTCDLTGALVAGGGFDIVIDVTVDSDTVGPTLTNDVAVSSSTPDPDPSDNTDSEDTTVDTSADLSVTKSDSSDPITAGAGPLTYTIDVTNDGPSQAAAVTLTDTVPAAFTVLTAVPDVGSCDLTVSCSLGPIDPLATVQVVVTVDVASDVAAGTYTNDVTVSSPTPDPDPSDDTDSEDTEVVTSANLAIAKSDVPDPVVAGENVTYTLSVTNAGPSDALAVQVVDTLSTDVSFVAAAFVGPATGSCVEAPTGTVTCDLTGPLVSGAGFDITITVTVDAGFSGPSISNTATVSSSTPDPDLANNSATEPTGVNAEADLSVAKTDSADPVVPGGPSFTYDVVVDNAGPSDAASVSVTDTLPPGVTFSSAVPSQGSCSEAAGVVTCPLGTVTAGGSATITITVAVPPGYTGPDPLTNTVTVTSKTPDPDPSGNTATEDTGLDPDADLGVTKFDSPDPVAAGTTLTYTVDVTNAGPTTAFATTAIDVLPAGVSFVSAVPDAGSCLEAAGIVTCGLGDIAPSDTVSITIVVAVPAGLPAGTLTNDISVASSTSDSDPSDNTASADTEVITEADLSVTKADSPDPIVAGTGNITYTVTVTNDGPSDAQAVQVVDTLPGAVTFVGAAFVAPAAGTCVEVAGVVTCDLTGPLAPGASFDVTIDAGVSALAPLGPATNAVSVSSTTSDPESGDNTDTEDTLIVGIADLEIVKTAAPDPVVAGTDLTYTLTVTNLGPSDALLVTLDDVLPAGLTLVSATSDRAGDICDASVACDLSTVALLETVTVTVVATVGSDAVVGSSIANTATVATAGDDPDPSNNTSTAAVTVAAEADLSVVKIDSPDPVVAGLTVDYTITVANAGPSDAESVVVTDGLPAGTTLVTAVADSGTCSAAAGVVTCTLGTLPAGATVAITINAAVDADVADGSTLVNTASVASSTPDPDPTDDTDVAETTVIADADLSVTKRGAPDPFVPGEPITWTIEITNAGPSDAVDLVITDLAGSGLTIVDVPAGCEIGAGGATATCERGTLAAGESITLTVVTDTAVGLRRVENVVEVSSGTADPVTANNRTGGEVDAVPPPIAFTGLTSTPMIVLAWMLMAAGAVLVMLGRRHEPVPDPMPVRRRPRRGARWW